MTRSSLTLYDLLKGTGVRKNLKFLAESQSWELERLKDLQGEKLSRLLDYVANEVRFYKKFGVRDIEEWPILNREMVMEAGDELLSDKINLKKCKVSRTGGTTGPPLRLYRDIETRS